MDSHLGTVVDGRYRLDRVLGEGAAGSVYAATQLSVDRTVAVKLLHAADGDRFAEEAKAIAKLNHTNIITLHDFGFDEALQAHFMVTEFAEGITLADRMAEVMSTDLILQIGLDLASAMHHAHANGILHRDLKPENVILTRADGRVEVAKVLDFGLAHLMAEDESDEAPSTAPEDAGVSQPDDEDQTRVLDPPEGESEGQSPTEPVGALLDPPPGDLETAPSGELLAPSLMELEAGPSSDLASDEPRDPPSLDVFEVVYGEAGEAEADAPESLSDDDDDDVISTTVLKNLDVSEDRFRDTE